MLPSSLRALAVAAALGALAMPAAAEDYANAHLLTSAEALAMLAAEPADLVMLDVRPLAEFEAGHIPGARQIDPNAVVDPHAPVDGTLRSIEELTTLLEELGVGAKTQVVLYDDKGGFHASRMFWLLEYLGHRQVSLLDGGVQAWTAAGEMLATGSAEAAVPASFSPALTPRRFASADWLLERREDTRTVVIDVRPEHLYAQGHIPWAQSIPWKANLDEDGTMKSAADLREHFEAHGVTPAANIVVHCQNGLASSHSYFALRLLGYPDVRTYHRSWAEWGSADDLPKTIPTGG